MKILLSSCLTLMMVTWPSKYVFVIKKQNVLVVQTNIAYTNKIAHIRVAK